FPRERRERTASGWCGCRTVFCRMMIGGRLALCRGARRRGCRVRGWCCVPSPMPTRSIRRGLRCGWGCCGGGLGVWCGCGGWRGRGEAARGNLRREAERQGVGGERLVFAPRVAGMAEHLARQTLADLYLDTQPYNAHSSACDALWASVPVLTCAGRSFAARV